MDMNLSETVQALCSQAITSLEELCRIPSVSFPDYDPAEVNRSAEAVASLLRETGFPEVKIVRNAMSAGKHGAPAVLAAWGHNPAKPTVLLYAHHDVQPEMRSALWMSPPFVPTIRNGRLFARGAADDKAGILVHAISCAALQRVAPESMPNIRVIIEGEEEVGSPGLAELLNTHKEFLQCDVAIVADLGNFRTGEPALTASLRGMIALEVEVTALERSLHSGIWSGPIPDPVQGLCKIIAGLSDANGRPTVPGLLEAVIPPDATTLESYQSLGITEEAFRAESGLKPSVKLWSKPQDIPIAQWRLPSITVTTIEAGNRKRAGNVLLNSAYARVSVRLVPGMQHETVVQQVSKAMQALCPWGLEISITHDEGANAWVTETSHPAFQKMLAALHVGYGKAPRIIGCGASIPGAPIFSQVFGEIPVLLTGLEDALANAHGENESLDLGDFQKAILAQAEFLRTL